MRAIDFLHKNTHNESLWRKNLKSFYKSKLVIFQELDELYQTMLKKFRHEDLEVWFMYGQFLLESGHATKARDLLQRALQSLPKTQRRLFLQYKIQC
jgi:DNA-directed RNA polymerase specialized sigma24 family protein